MRVVGKVVLQSWDKYTLTASKVPGLAVGGEGRGSKAPAPELTMGLRRSKTGQV